MTGATFPISPNFSVLMWWNSECLREPKWCKVKTISCLRTRFIWELCLHITKHWYIYWFKLICDKWFIHNLPNKGITVQYKVLTVQMTSFNNKTKWLNTSWSSYGRQIIKNKDTLYNVSEERIAGLSRTSHRLSQGNLRCLQTIGFFGCAYHLI